MLYSKRADPTINNQAPYRRLLSWGLNSLLQYFTENPTVDTHGIKLIRLELIRPIVERCVINRGQFDTELTIRCVDRLPGVGANEAHAILDAARLRIPGRDPHIASK